MLRKSVTISLECLHLTLLFSIFLPFFYMFAPERESMTEFILFFTGFLILLPIVIAKFGAVRSKSILSYLLLFGIAFFAMWSLSQKLGGYFRLKGTSILCMLVLCTETIFVFIEMFCERMERFRKKKAYEEEDISWKPKDYLLEEPRIGFVTVFVIIYVFALNFESKILCNQAFFTAVFYLFLALIYRYIEETEDYFDKNKDIRQIPYKRIYGISSRIFFLFLFLLAVAILPSVFLSGKRSYRDLREWMAKINVDYEQIVEPSEKSEEKDRMEEILEEYQKEQEPAPEWVNQLAYVLGVFCLLGSLYVILHSLRTTFSKFREAYDEENGDYVEEIENKEREKRLKRRQPGKKGSESERERIRRQYRLWIRSYRKEIPDPAETPAEIEKNAKIEETLESRRIHELYERARYGANNKLYP